MWFIIISISIAWKDSCLYYQPNKSYRHESMSMLHEMLNGKALL